MRSLNPQQKAAVNATNTPLLVLAGAGSGKTSVITAKIAHLIRQGMSARHIAAITFTNKAAREMKSRISTVVDSKQIRGLTVSTFHSLGLEILRKEHQKLGYKSRLSLFDEQDKKTLLKELIRHDSTGLLNDDDLDRYVWQISQWKNGFILPSFELSQATDGTAPAAQLYQLYQDQLKAYNAVDFDDLILLPVQLLEKDPVTLNWWQQKIRYLLVDEYQDTNATQYQLVKLLIAKSRRFTAVGDDDQSIYAWRGARPENIALLQRDFPDLEVIKLEQNYRSTRRILRAANHLIANNPHPFEKTLWSQKEEGVPLKILTHKNEQEEAERIASEIIGHKFRSGGRYKDYAILYRGNHQSRLFEKSLRENGVPCFISGGTSFFSQTEVKDILCYLRVLVNPEDDAAFLRVINVPRREIGPSTLEKLGNYATQRKISLFSACFEYGLGQVLPNKARGSLEQFCHFINDTSDRAKRGDTFAVLNQMLDAIQYNDWIKDSHDNDKVIERKLGNVKELMDWLERLAQSESEDSLSIDDSPLEKAVSKIQLLDILERNQEEEQGDRVTLMTYHSAKGLEFPHVFMVGTEEGILPHQNSIDEENIEEERRLAYVGITRAQKTCTLSYCAHRKRYGEIQECEPSRFLNELPESDIEWNAKQNKDPATQKKHGRETLAGLRAMLA
ncbi:UvrD-helicase domain-containing protein (plasmid) [Methylomarinum sp. Ch1-1]|uniref:ATP-dependent DNA helicase Rep n=1 Tax=Methylomarinum roseum TaxID=3067653 RepID=A0AAU7P0E2_9GAMM|nr:UvrD-helicase domain-containing protein [Methylomarinum sp. Ch1-1]MDP4518966.1 3'-5' exonuclease [Methylomarinum sp. Ch1-1]MDP4523364.1 3'-5' exonuclease [Methylomarinum sp. Ch1-1]